MTPQIPRHRVSFRAAILESYLSREPVTATEPSVGSPGTASKASRYHRNGFTLIPFFRETIFKRGLRIVYVEYSVKKRRTQNVA